MNVACSVKQITLLAEDTYQVLLQPLTPISFQAGQYLMVVMGEKDKRPFSIANAPSQGNELLELHIGATAENSYAHEVMEKLRSAFEQQQTVMIDMPHGTAWVQETSERPLLLIAGGTGFSYIRSILTDQIQKQSTRTTYVYWGARTQVQLYALPELFDIAETYPNVSFIPVIEDSSNSNWQGKVGNVVAAIETDFASLAEFDIYIAGRFEMASIARERFSTLKQADPQRMFADAYAFI